jgi:hypothetical protein
MGPGLVISGKGVMASGSWLVTIILYFGKRAMRSALASLEVAGAGVWLITVGYEQSSE